MPPVFAHNVAKMAASLTWSDLAFEHPVGAGQAGEVWQARLTRSFRDLPVGTIVAVKRYKRWVMEQPGQYERMYRELALGMKVNHPNVVSAYCLVNSPDGLPCLVMRHYDGITLDSLLHQQREDGRVISLPDAFKLLRGIGAGITALHDQGALHRDVKPANVLIGPDGTPVLMDLGVVTETVLPEHTKTEQFLGTIRYAQPEYLLGLRCGPESDAYSLGAIAYEALSGERFLGSDGNWASLVARIVTRRSPTARDVARICQQLTERDGLWAGEAFYWVTQSMLRAPSTSTIREFCAAVDLRFWEQPFFDANGCVELGMPDAWDGSHGSKWPFQAVDSVWSIEAMQTELLGNASTPDSLELDEILHSRYWRWRSILDGRNVDPDEIAEIEADLAYFFDGEPGGRGHYGVWLTEEAEVLNLARALLLLHRHDLIRQIF